MVAGEEEAGILDLTLSQPVRRPKVAPQRFAVLATAVAVMLAVFLLAMLAIAVPAQLAIAVPAQLDPIPVARFVAMHAHLWAFTVLSGGLSFVIGAASGRRSPAWELSGGVAVLANAASGIILQAEGLEWVRDYCGSAWINGSTPLSSGLDPGQALLRVALSPTFVAVGTVLLTRRSIAAARRGPGVWP